MQNNSHIEILEKQYTCIYVEKIIRLTVKTIKAFNGFAKCPLRAESGL